MVERGENLYVDHDLARIQRFQQQLGMVESVRLHDVRLDFDNEELPVDALMRLFMTYERCAEPTLYLNNGQVPDSIRGPAEFEPRVARGSRHSAHGVFFGDLKFADNRRIGVAVKPHEGDYSITSCLRDYYNTEAIRQLNIDGLTPIGFLIQEGHPAYSITRLNRSISTLDSIDWTNYFEQRHQNPGMTEIWLKVARQGAFVHSLGRIAHNDMAARNTATTPQGNIFFIDWERAYISLQQPRDAEVRYGISHSDTNTLLESMWLPPHAHPNFKGGIGLFYGQNEEEVWQAFREIYLDEYIICRQQYADMGNHHNEILRATGEELKQLERELREDVAMYAANLGKVAITNS